MDRRMSDDNGNDTPPDATPGATPEPEHSVEQPVDEQADASSAGEEGQAEGEVDGAGEQASTDDEAAALAAAMAAVNQLQGVADSAGVQIGTDDAEPFVSPELQDSASGDSKTGMDLLADVHMNVRIELGRTKMFVEDVLKLKDGAVVELDKLAGDPVDVFVNERKVARGEVLVLNDLFCVRISEIVDIAKSDA